MTQSAARHLGECLGKRRYVDVRAPEHAAELHVDLDEEEEEGDDDTLYEQSEQLPLGKKQLESGVDKV